MNAEQKRILDTAFETQPDTLPGMMSISLMLGDLPCMQYILDDLVPKCSTEIQEAIMDTVMVAIGEVLQQLSPMSTSLGDLPPNGTTFH